MIDLFLSSLPVLLIIWSIWGFVWMCDTDHPWTDKRKTTTFWPKRFLAAFVAGPIYWVAELAFRWIDRDREK